jgi:hypothetical protein
MGFENADGCSQNTVNGLALTFLERYHIVGDEFLNHIARVTKQWMYTHSPNKLNKFKQTLFARMLMVTAFWERKGVLIVELCNKGPQ